MTIREVIDLQEWASNHNMTVCDDHLSSSVVVYDSHLRECPECAAMAEIDQKLIEAEQGVADIRSTSTSLVELLKQKAPTAKK